MTEVSVPSFSEMLAVLFAPGLDLVNEQAIEASMRSLDLAAIDRFATIQHMQNQLGVFSVTRDRVGKQLQFAPRQGEDAVTCGCIDRKRDGLWHHSKASRPVWDRNAGSLQDRMEIGFAHRKD